MEEKFIVEGPKLKLTLSHLSVGEIVLQALRNHGDRILQIDSQTKETLSASFLLRQVVRLAKWLRAIGIGVGDFISINSENRLEFCAIPLTAFFIGAVFTPLNPEYTAGELQHVLNLSKPKIVFCSDKTIDKMQSILSEHSHIQYLVVFGGHQITDNKTEVILFDDIIKDVRTDFATEIQDFVVQKVNPQEDLAMVSYSSGTTGLPKGVMLSHSNFTAFFDIARIALTELNATQNVNEPPIVGLVPFFHSFGFFVLLMSILRGVSLVVMSKFTPKLFLEVLETYKVSSIHVPPPVILFLTKNPLVEKYNLSNLKDIASGAAPLSKNSENSVLKKFKSVNSIRQSYGMTETTLAVTMNYAGKIKSGSVGQVVPGVKLKIINENGEPLGPHLEGELCVKGPIVMKGYLNDKKATAETIDKNGWLHTGDIGYFDDENFLFIVDRIKELIKYKGYQVAPAELEALLIKHPEVTDAAVVGLPDEDAGELPVAFVVTRLKSKITPAELEKYVAENVSRHKKLRGGIYFVKEIPRNPSGKILRRLLKERAIYLKSKL